VAEIIVALRYGEISQGCIFTNARAEDYDNCNVYGLVITARCDIANDKVNKYNYLPIVTYNDWLKRDYFNIITDRAKSQEIGSVKGILKELGLSQTLITTEKLIDIYDGIFKVSSERKITNKSKAFLGAVERNNVLDNISLENISSKHLMYLQNTYKGIAKGIVSELLNQKLNGYYYLNAISPTHEEGEHFVILLREVNHIPRVLAMEIAHGLDYEPYITLCQQYPSAIGRLEMTPDSFCMPLGAMKSPNIEHLMQKFAELFGRIGIDDPDESLLSSLLTL
jgi:hypothetical protein